MFWSQVDDNSINDLLNKEDVSLEEVLDHESILQECKIQNDKLIQFLSKGCNFWALINYVLFTPSDNIEEKLRFKYPSLVCEVLTSDVPVINELLVNGVVTDGPNDSGDMCTVTIFVDRALENFDKETTMNPLTLSYIIKILLHILKHNNNIVMSRIMKKENSIDLFLKHVDNNAIALFFTELLMCEDESTEILIQWLKEGNFLSKCVRLFGVNENRNNSVQTLLCKVISASSKFFANKVMIAEIRNQLNGKEFLDTLFGHLSNPKADCNLITGCLRVLRTIIDFETESEELRMDNVKDMVLKHFFSVVTLLSSPPKQKYDPMPTTMGLMNPFGPTRLEIVYLIESLLRLKDEQVIKCIGATNVFMVLMAFVPEYKWNTMFHLGLLKIFDLVFADLTADSRYLGLIEHLVSESDIYHWYMSLIEQTAKRSSPRSGSMGLLWKIGNHLDGLWSSQVTGLLINREIEEKEAWSRIVKEHLEPRNSINVVSAPKIDSCFKDIDMKMVDIDEDTILKSSNVDIISDFFRKKNDNLSDMFGASSSANDDDWLENELNMQKVPVDDFPHSLPLPKEPLSQFENSDDSSSDDEVSPSVIKQKSEGKAAKYLVSDVTLNGDIGLLDVPTFSDDDVSSLTFDNPWNSVRCAPDSAAADTVKDNWASF